MSLSIQEYMQLCRLCLVKDKVNVPIFGDGSDVRQIFFRITTCLPVKMSQDDNLPKKICDSCLYKVDLLYQFRNTSVNAEKQLIQWLSTFDVDVKLRSCDPLPTLHSTTSLPPETILLKEEQPDPDSELKDNLYQSGYGDPLRIKMGAEAQNEGKEQIHPSSRAASVVKRPRGRPPKHKTQPKLASGIISVANATTATNPSTEERERTERKRRRTTISTSILPAKTKSDSESSEESAKDDRLAEAASDDSDDNDDKDFSDDRPTKEEVDSEDEENVDNPNALEPTTFVSIPSAVSGEDDTDQPGPSGLTTSDKSAAEGSPEYSVASLACPLYERIPKNSPPSKLYSCKHCNEKFPKYRQMYNHLVTHKSKTVPCTECPSKFRTTHEMKAHRKMVHDLAARKFACSMCDKRYVNKFALDQHFRHHSKDYFGKCDKCGKGFYKRQHLEEHQQVVHGGVRFICFPCDKTFRSSRYLAIHMKERHHPDYQPTEHKCPDCQEVFLKRYAFRKHIRIHNKFGPLKYVCDLCGKVVNSSGSLRDHKMLHSGDKPFVCQTCGKAFNKTSLLKLHELTHTNERPHACPHCDKRFTQRNTLTIHLRYHTGERPYPCNICDKAFVSRNQMKVHSKVHGTALADL